MSSLDQLLADGIIEEVVTRLKSGKEADLYLVQHRGEIVAAKIYKERHARNFHNNAAYREGRAVRNTRTQRAIDKGTRFGQAAAEEAWKATESDALHKLHAIGMRVPQPILFYEGVLLMEVVVDADGHPAPRLIDAHVPKEVAAPFYADLRSQVVKMLTCDLIHGDLSPYNILLAWNGPTIIDFPQVVGAAHNRQAASFFERDLRTLHRFFADIDPALHAHAGDAQKIWRAYERRELTADFVPSPGEARREHVPGERREYVPGERPQRGPRQGGRRHEQGGHPSGPRGAHPGGPQREPAAHPGGHPRREPAGPSGGAHPRGHSASGGHAQGRQPSVNGHPHRQAPPRGHPERDPAPHAAHPRGPEHPAGHGHAHPQQRRDRSQGEGQRVGQSHRGQRQPSEGESTPKAHGSGQARGHGQPHPGARPGGPGPREGHRGDRRPDRREPHPRGQQHGGQRPDGARDRGAPRGHSKGPVVTYVGAQPPASGSATPDAAPGGARSGSHARHKNEPPR